MGLDPVKMFTHWALKPSHITSRAYISVLTSMMGASGGTSLFGWSSSSFLPFFTTRGRWSSPSICSLAGDGGGVTGQTADKQRTESPAGRKHPPN